jgi:NCS1 family nucleobase:cation symporter-1
MTSAMPVRSDRLYNSDLAPTTGQVERTWGTFSLTSVWFAAIHNMGQYTMAAGLIFLGIKPVPLVLGCLLGFVISYLASLVLGFAGQRHGVPYPVLARVSFGVYGSNLPALIRAVVAVCWYGIQTYLASRAIIVLLELVWPATAQLDHNGFLGLSYLGWICFLLLWAAQLVVVTHGLETVRKFQNYAGAAISVLMVVIALVLLSQAHWTLDLSVGGASGSLGHQVNTFFSTGGLWIATFATLVLNFCDFSRFAPNRRAIVWGGLWGLPVNGALFMAVVIVATLASKQIYGTALTDPTQMLAKTHNNAVIVGGAVVFILATIGVNVIANLVSPAYDLANVFPKHINFTRGAYISCVCALLVFPWKLYASAATVHYFLGALGAVLGPIFGIIIVDYYLVKRQRVDVDALYSDGPSGAYFYQGGWNLRAVAALVPAGVVSVVMSVMPALSAASAYTWFVGVALAAATYLVLSAAWKPVRTPAAATETAAD